MKAEQRILDSGQRQLTGAKRRQKVAHGASRGPNVKNKIKPRRGEQFTPHTSTKLLPHIIFSNKARMPTREPDLKQRLSPTSQKQTVVDYIANQEEHHRKVSFKEEFIAF